MASLFAVEPEGGCRVHRDAEGRDTGRVGGHRLVTRVGTTGHGLARRGERRLCHGVVLGVECERDGITDGGSGLTGREGKARGTDLNLDVCRRDCGCEGGEGNGGKMKTHFDCLLKCFV